MGIPGRHSRMDSRSASPDRTMDTAHNLSIGGIVLDPLNLPQGVCTVIVFVGSSAIVSSTRRRMTRRE